MNLDAIKNRIATLETAIQQVVQNHSGLVIALQEAKNCLQIATEVSEVIAPESPVTVGLTEAEAVAKSVE